MHKAKIRAIVRCLSFSKSNVCLPPSFRDGNAHTWKRVLDWLDSSGLSLYFLQRLKWEGMTESLPSDLLLQLEQRQETNRQRIAGMRRAFDKLNREFREAGVRYAAIKGFSLAPQYCPDPSLRAQSDLDYYVAGNSLDRACRILAGHGYVLKKQTGDEFCFWIPCQTPTSYRAQYDAQTPFTIELHRTIWELGIPDVPTAIRSVPFEKMQLRDWEGAFFYSLPEHEIFLGQAFHAFRHLVIDGVRPSWLLEIGHFLKHNSSTSSFLREIRQATEDDPLTGSIAGIIIGLVIEVFGCPHPAAAQCVEQLNPAMRNWLSLYGRDLVLEACPGYGQSLFPATKVLIFLRQEMVPDNRARTAMQRNTLIPLAGLRGLAKKSSAPNATVLHRVTNRGKWFFSRVFHHAGSNLRYLAELPRWYRINRRVPPRTDVKPAGIPVSPDLDGRFLT
jgi:hypothetical protein